MSKYKHGDKIPIEIKQINIEGGSSIQFTNDNKCMGGLWDSVGSVFIGAEEDKWQPIETAPSNEIILVYDGQDMAVAFRSVSEKGWVYSDHFTKLKDNYNYPTHWMPLPSPPKNI